MWKCTFRIELNLYSLHTTSGVKNRKHRLQFCHGRHIFWFHSLVFLRGMRAIAAYSADRVPSPDITALAREWPIHFGKVGCDHPGKQWPEQGTYIFDSVLTILSLEIESRRRFDSDATYRFRLFFFKDVSVIKCMKFIISLKWRGWREKTLEKNCFYFLITWLLIPGRGKGPRGGYPKRREFFEFRGTGIISTRKQFFFFKWFSFVFFEFLPSWTNKIALIIFIPKKCVKIRACLENNAEARRWTEART